MTYTIKEIADLAGVSTRTLRYYDEIGLLSPAEVGGNGYRYYDHGSLLRLQQIMFFRELDVPLKDIQEVMSRPDFAPLTALEQHRHALEQRAVRLAQLIETVDQTIATLQGDWMMSDKDYFDGFDESQYEEEVRQRWGDTEKYAVSQKRWKSYSKEQKEAIKVEAGEISLRMVPIDPSIPPDDSGVQAAIGDYLAYLNRYFYPCDAEFLRLLSDMWVQDERFAINYERIRPGGTAFIREAVHIFADNQ